MLISGDFNWQQRKGYEYFCKSRHVNKFVVSRLRMYTFGTLRLFGELWAEFDIWNFESKTRDDKRACAWILRDWSRTGFFKEK